MKKLLFGGFAVFAGVVALPAPGSLKVERKAPVANYLKDPRFLRLRSFFEKFDCPAKRYADQFIAAADRYALDWRLLPSISYVESTGGKSARFNNIFGWNSGRAHFPSPIAGIHEVGYRLTHSALYRSKTLDQILATYNPVSAYGQRVKAVMTQIAPAR